jgi:beta-phosphoglucomutase-like phosphatase (HAD superfamily)
VSLWQRYHAMLFDFNGVIARTSVLHAAAWQRVFDEFLAARSRTDGRTFEPFDPGTDYELYLDGRGAVRRRGGLPRLPGHRAVAWAS